MQLCNRIYYSKVYWRLNIFRAAHHSSSGALYCICSIWFLYPYADRPLPRLSGKWMMGEWVNGWWIISFHFPLSLGNGRSPYGHINQRLQIQFRAPDDERVPLETWWAFKKPWNNKFYYKAASCWYFYWENMNHKLLY
jgi:hypothetical protein